MDVTNYCLRNFFTFIQPESCLWDVDVDVDVAVDVAVDVGGTNDRVSHNNPTLVHNCCVRSSVCGWWNAV